MGALLEVEQIQPMHAANVYGYFMGNNNGWQINRNDDGFFVGSDGWIKVPMDGVYAITWNFFSPIYAHGWLAVDSTNNRYGAVVLDLA